MRLRVIGRLVVVTLMLALPITAYAQEATLSGTITDTTGGVLPGVTVTAVHESSGNTFVAVTDERGAYRLAARVGVYRITMELSGFTTLTRTGLELLVGQQAVANLQMAPSAVEESVTVTAETPLIDVTSSTLSGNIDPRQMQELPVNGRNWLDLALLAPGSRSNEVNPGGDPVPRPQGAFQINVDGQQVTNLIQLTFGQPGFSRDALEEFEFIANRFDATQGRSSGVQINAISKSGSNTHSGSVSGYFRNDRFNAADFVQRRVLPYSDQQVSVTYGGPIRRDKFHFFANYEFEREPQTFAFSSPWPRFNIDLSGIRKEYKAGARLDFQFSPQIRLAVRGNKWTHLIPHDPRFTGGATVHPSGASYSNRYSDELHAVLTQVLSNRALNQVKVGYASFRWKIAVAYAKWPDSPAGQVLTAAVSGIGAPTIRLRGYTIGQNHQHSPQYYGQDTPSVRDDFNISFTKGGRHDMKLGGEYYYNLSWLPYWCNWCLGEIDATGGPVPANIEDLFPVWNDVSTWNLAALSPITVRYRRNLGNFAVHDPRHVYAAWVQDDWAVTPRLTLNLGVRYDLAIGALGEKIGVLPFLPPNRPSDTNNIGPRLGFAFGLTDRTVLRGGSGKYFADVVDSWTHRTAAASQQIMPETPNDGRPDFAANPYNGPAPTYDEAVLLRPRRELPLSILSPDTQMPYSYQTSIGVQRQLGNTTAFEADYVWTAARHEIFARSNINLSYNPATRANYPFTDISTRPYPDWGLVAMSLGEGRSNYHALQTAFTKRLSRGWQASGTYTLSGLWDAEPLPVSGLSLVTFPVAPDLGGEYTLAAADQRHRAVVNGIWQLGYGFQLSGLYFFGSGQRFSIGCGCGDRRNTGGPAAEGRLRPDGTIVPRNNLVGKPIHRVDLRVQRRFRLGGRAAVNGILEVFNLFNHANYGSYVTQESNRNYGQPSFNANVAYQPRMLQLGFRLTF